MLFIGLEVILWLERRLGETFDHQKSIGIGWLDKDQNIVIGACFTDYDGYNLNVHIAKNHNVPIPPTFIAAFCHYPFCQANVQRITGIIPEYRNDALRFALAIGGHPEGRIRKGIDGYDLIIYGMLKEEASCWLTARMLARIEKGQHYGKVSTEPTTTS